MPDTVDNQQAFPQQACQAPGLGFPIVRFVALISLQVGTVLDYALAPYQGKGSGETSLLSSMLGSLKSGDLLLADRYYATWALVHLLQQAGVHVLMPVHARRKVDFRRGHRLGTKDHLVVWRKPSQHPVWMSAADYRALPDQITVRELAVDGRIYVTTLVEPKPYHRHALAELYRQRWAIELDFRSIKTDMGMERLRCKTAEMVRREIAVNLLAYNLIRAAMARAAKLGGRHPRQLSFKSAVQLLSIHSIALSKIAGRELERQAAIILMLMASVMIGQQSRGPQPRAVKRRPKPFPQLTRPRREECNLLKTDG